MPKLIKMASLVLLLAIVGCGEKARTLKKKGEKLLADTKSATSKIEDKGKELVDSALNSKCAAQWDVVIDHIESRGLKIRELAALYKEKKWYLLLKMQMVRLFL